MIDLSVFSALVAALLLFAVIFVWLRRDLTAMKLPAPMDSLPGESESDLDPCPLEFVSKIFCSDDLSFVSRMDSPYLQKLFQRERRAVALCWVQQTAATARGIVRGHLEASRRQQDLVFLTEMGILLRYVQIQSLCFVMSLSIRLAGLQRMRALAIYADGVALRLNEAHRAFLAATDLREPQRSPSP
jgi:hypothetical protein